MNYDSNGQLVGYVARRLRDTPHSEACMNILKASVGRDEMMLATHIPVFRSPIPNEQNFDMQPLNLGELNSPEMNSAFAGQGSEVCPLS